MNVLHFTGMSSKKYGGLERFFVYACKNGHFCGIHHTVVYNAVPGSDEFRNALNSVSGAYVVLPFRNKIRFLFQVFYLLYSKKADVVQTYFDLHVALIVQFVAFLCGVKKRIVSQHLLYQPSSRKNYWAFRFLLLLASDVLCVSEGVKKNIESLFPKSAHKLRVIYIGVESQYYSASICDEIKGKLSIPKDALVIGNVAFHHPMKGVDILLKAFTMIASRYPNAILLQIGNYECEEGKKNRESIIAAGFEKQVIFLGMTDHVARYMRIMDFYVQPSRSEAIGLALMEACEAGLPVIGSNVGGIPEVVHHGINGLLFPIEDSGKLAECLEQMLDDKEKRRLYAKASRDIFQTNFNLEKQVPQYLSFYMK